MYFVFMVSILMNQLVCSSCSLKESFLPSYSVHQECMIMHKKMLLFVVPKVLQKCQLTKSEHFLCSHSQKCETHLFPPPLKESLVDTSFNASWSHGYEQHADASITFYANDQWEVLHCHVGGIT